MNRKSRRIRIRGKWWTIRYETPPKREARGLCNLVDRVIFVHPRHETVQTLIHEVLHALYWDLDEDAVLAGEEALMNALAPHLDHSHE